MLDAQERESVALGLHPLVLGEELGHGQDTTTFALANDRSKVVKVFRRFALRDVDYERRLSSEGLTPRIFASKGIGLLDTLLVERVVPFETLDDLSVLETEQVLGLCLRLPQDFGLVNWNLGKSKSLAKTRTNVNPTVCMLDTGRCHEFDLTSRLLSDEEKLWSTALHFGLCCLQPSKKPLPKTPWYQAFASLLVNGRPHAHGGDSHTLPKLLHTLGQKFTVESPACANMSYLQVLQRGCLNIVQILAAKSQMDRDAATAELTSLKQCAFTR